MENGSNIQSKIAESKITSTYSWNAGTMIEQDTHQVGTKGISNSASNGMRMYMNLSLPTLPKNPRIRKAELVLTQKTGYVQSATISQFGLFRVKDNFTVGTSVFPEHETALIDYDRITTGADVKYTFDITSLLDELNAEGVNSANLVVKMLDETPMLSQHVQFYGASNNDYAPKLVATYESNYSSDTSYRSHTNDILNVGQGNVDLACGSLTITADDFAWSGNRMPVTIRHLYNSTLSEVQYTNNDAIGLKTADFSAMKLGLGWKLNIMQSMIATVFSHEDTEYTGYVFVDESGVETYFKVSNETAFDATTSQNYSLYEDVSGFGMIYDPVKHTISNSSETYLFDSEGRLIQISDKYSSMTITYTSGKITSVTDGVGRIFSFEYDGSGFLTKITAPDGSAITYSYNNNRFIRRTLLNGNIVIISYDSTNGNLTYVTNHLSTGAILHRIGYTYENNRVASVTEYGTVGLLGTKTEFEYNIAARNTIVTVIDPEETENTLKTVYAFDDEGNIISEYMYSEETGNVGTNRDAGITPVSNNGIVSNINNLLLDHNFNSLDHWSLIEDTTEEVRAVNYSSLYGTHYGRHLLYMNSNVIDGIRNGVGQSVSLPAGQYTFSAYFKVIKAFEGDAKPGVFVSVYDESGAMLATSEHLAETNGEWMRLIASFELTEAKTVSAQILMNCKGTAYCDAAQLENTSFANAYNMLENSNFENGTNGWNLTNSQVSAETPFNMTKSLKVFGQLDNECFASQTVNVNNVRATRETFRLSGWAKGCGLTVRERNNSSTPIFRLRADLVYNDASTESFVADFSACTDAWQFASVEFAKSKYLPVASVSVFCEYSYNNGIAYFDDIQLIRESIETDLSESDFLPADEDYDDAEQYDEEITADNTAPAFEEAVDEYGNSLTETTFSDGEFGTLYRSFTYGNSGNDMIAEHDARNNETLYVVDESTSRNEEIIDRCGNKTAYTYDNAGRLTAVESFKNSGDDEYEKVADVAYAYNMFDGISQITRGDGMGYAIAYDRFNNLASIGVKGKTEKLVSYTYKTGSGRLKSVTYANGDKMEATYNSIGQMIGETWTDAEGNITAQYKYLYDGAGNIVRSLDITAYREYTYVYEGDRIVRATQSEAFPDSNGISYSRDPVNTIFYSYDSEGQLVKKRIVPVVGEESVYYYENTEGNTIVKCVSGGKTFTSHSKTDSFGRKVFDELQLGTGFVSREFSYLAGVESDEHVENCKLKSTPTTQLVSQIRFADNRTLSYEYDAEERITKVTDSVDGITEYTYDSLGQLLTETVNGVVVNTMTYDNYGNIVTKNGKNYTYGDSAWKDLLTSYDGQSISYDAQGNPVSYLGHTLTWEKGRQLKSFDDITYNYNANGIRTSKCVNDVHHYYFLDGTKILREFWEGNSLIPMYDNEDSVCGIIHNDTANDTAYYFCKNLQGDVVAITDTNGDIVVRYTYDAWGVPTAIVNASGADISNDATHIANINPFRYRGYYFDTETGLYYLQSRYYNPILGRFLNADVPTYIGAGSICSFDIFTYCENNCVNLIDYFGHAPSLSTLTSMHHAVVQSVRAFLLSVGIVANTEVRTCNQFGSFIGRMDVYSYSKNMVWEIKRNNPSGISSGTKQLRQYQSSYVYSLYHSWFNKRYVKPQAGTVYVYGAIVKSNYLVTYHSAYNSVRELVLYDYMTLDAASELLFKVAVAQSARYKTKFQAFSKQIKNKINDFFDEVRDLVGDFTKVTATVCYILNKFISALPDALLVILAIIILICTGVLIPV